MNEILKFTDFGFKLAVINKLMYESSVITPKFNAEKYLEQVRGLEEGDGYDVIEDEGYDIIPELKAYFENIEITKEMVQEITELTSDGGDTIYGDICPFWDGEDAVFDVKSAEDVKLLPKLTKARLLFKWPGDDLIADFKKLGVALESI